jgi:hypothetical protein
VTALASLRPISVNVTTPIMHAMLKTGTFFDRSVGAAA